MGHTIEKLAERNIGKKTVFNSRMVLELCEKAHIHYRNIRIILSLDDFINVSEAFVSGLERWKKRGCPGTGVNQHIELCRKKVAINDDSDTVQINLNDNLYKKNEGGIFSEGAEFFEDDKYIHFKIRDTRIELSIKEFNEIAEAVKEAQEKLNATITA